MRNKLSNLIANLTGWRKALLAFLAGAIVTLALPPVDFLPAGFIGFPLLILLIDNDTIRRNDAGTKPFRAAFYTGWLFGFGYFLAGLWWIGMALLVDADAFAWALPLAMLGLPAFLAVFFAAAAGVARIFWGAGIIRILVLAICLGLSEWLRSFILTGFPWNALGYAAMPSPLFMQSVTITGLYGMNSLAVLVFAMPALFFGTQKQRYGWRSGLAIALILLTAHIGYGLWRLRHAPEIDNQSAADAPIIRLVQPSIAQDAKWDNQLRRAIFDRHLDLTTRPPAQGHKRPDIIIWPETSVPYVLPQTEPALQAMGQALQPGQLILAGAVLARETMPDDPDPLYYNSIFAIDHNGQVTATAEKVHLVPFGEYLPLEGLLRSFGIQEVVEMPGGFTAAPQRHSLAVNPQLTFLPLICYEAIFPSELGYQGKPVDAIINITNDAWYGNTPGPYQHFRQAQLRAVEQGVPLMRAANNGISAITDPYGRITSGLKLNEIGFIDAPLPTKTALFWGKPAEERQFFSILIILLVFSVVFHVRRTKCFG